MRLLGIRNEPGPKMQVLTLLFPCVPALCPPSVCCLLTGFLPPDNPHEAGVREV